MTAGARTGSTSPSCKGVPVAEAEPAMHYYIGYYHPHPNLSTFVSPYLINVKKRSNKNYKTLKTLKRDKNKKKRL